MITQEDKENQLKMPYEEKVKRTKELILEWYLQYKGKVYVSFSGGKDSTVLLHIARSIKGCENILAMFIDTGLEYPEVRTFVKQKENVYWVKPKLTFKQVINKYGWPIISKEQAKYIRDAKHGSEHIKDIRLNNKNFSVSKKWRYLIDADFEISDRCCYVMKKSTAKKFEKETGLKPIIGMMACESKQRLTKYFGSNCNAFTAKRPVSNPIIFWNEQDILRYIVENCLEIPSVYGDIQQTIDGRYYLTGVKRTGCMFCMFGLHLEKKPNRFDMMKETHPKQYEYIMDNLNGRHVLNCYLKGK